MKTTSLVLAALLATAGAAIAGDDAASLKFPQSQEAGKTVILDARATGSVKAGADHALRRTGEHAATGERQIGIDVSPWVMPVFH